MAPSILPEDSALLQFSGAVLYNNVYGKGDIADYRQLVFRGQDDAGWEWDWPECGPSMKSYPEVLLGRSACGRAVKTRNSGLMRWGAFVRRARGQMLAIRAILAGSSLAHHIV